MFLSALPIYPIAGIREIEGKLIPSARPPLMERAGRAAAEDAVRLIMDRPGPILIACGPGNNGGDGFVMARQLTQAGRDVQVAFTSEVSNLPAEAAKAYADYLAAGGHLVSDLPAAPAQGWALVVDALFGIGLKRRIEGRCAGWIQTLNAQPSPRMALDVPSGLDADTGLPLGTTFRATHTTTFISLKPGLLTNDGPDYCGDINVQRLEIDAPAWLPAAGHAVTPALFHGQLRPRPRNSHKGLYGDAGILGGNAGMVGAALLAGRSAFWLGTGRVYVGLLDPNGPAVDFAHPELMLRQAARLPERLSALAVGPGLGTDMNAATQLAAALGREVPLVLDADALNLIASDATLRTRLAARQVPSILTPHPAEAGRLLGIGTEAVQADRLQAALDIAARHRALVVLKGCGSIVASPDGRWFINGSGHPGMASAGMGDVLTGLVVGLLAQGWPAESALIAAVHLHGAAADRLAREGIGPIGLSASETIDAARGVFNGWLIEAQQGPHRDGTRDARPLITLGNH
ncbi:bifunctional ADP-dependent NAD(P)H-hydrate dehydratase/NAD(P)H-hydrate epimerase [Thauera linaloolentis]|uniref:Bifunctional NAD(P)H-hydrate repair enzyme n=1 Tax=Thauera linaloolentis (strain DSM 12138 / JCM 21573 / CCUG 41526 / CIP 105981 / IAM 15112 / NBRC 102519 / 47Lol) TaxID=1123367 RepID=N6Y3I4_THAL4|nr:bifunctional ADP-dependent NAD(P)H-hydrate dehydratase/NAD(P)H-hydrate epimerase [Thauera linaloolentis]ENO88761.1 carbohydrate kinase [Thauera linaloolentis 47Lol = DSM 12138]MCM8564930.1 bifunctional ADP-dependent NAD(P)H-hydrate dehydratase/NAD(P)H-hydrate epimerase [Thauera linaloolentis]